MNEQERSAEQHSHRLRNIGAFIGTILGSSIGIHYILENLNNKHFNLEVGTLESLGATAILAIGFGVVGGLLDEPPKDPNQRND